METDLHSWMFAFIRSSGVLLSLPIFAAANVPVLVRVAFAALLGVLISPAMPAEQAHAGLWSSVSSLAVEALIGLALGFTGRLVFGAIELAGQIITTELGLNLSAILNPMSSVPTQAPGMMLFFLGAVLLFSLDMHHWMIAALAKSYEIVPPGGAHVHEALLVGVVRQSSQMFVIALQIVAPVMAVSFIVTWVFAMLGRAVPQMNVFSESFAFRIMAGLLVFAFTLPIMAQHITNTLRRWPEDMLRVAEWMR